MKDQIDIKLYGDRAIELSWQQSIDLKTSETIQSISHKILAEYQDIIEDLIPAYASLLVVFSQPFDFEMEKTRINSIITTKALMSNIGKNRWFIPVCYDVSLGWDVEELCQIKNLEPSALISL